MTCNHDWNATSTLRLIIAEPDMDFMANIFPISPKVLQVEFCRQCGVLRISPATAQAIAGVELERQEAETAKVSVTP